MEELKQAIAELKTSYGKVAELLGTAHPVSKKVLGIIREHGTDNAHQIIKESMDQKKAPKGQNVADRVKTFFKKL